MDIKATDELRIAVCSVLSAAVEDHHLSLALSVSTEHMAVPGPTGSTRIHSMEQIHEVVSGAAQIRGETLILIGWQLLLKPRPLDSTSYFMAPYLQDGIECPLPCRGSTPCMTCCIRVTVSPCTAMRMSIPISSSTASLSRSIPCECSPRWSDG